MGELLYLVAVFIVNANQRTREGEYLSKSDQHTVVNLAQRWVVEPRREQCAPEGAHYYCGDELDLAHAYMP